MKEERDTRRRGGRGQGGKGDLSGVGAAAAGEAFVELLAEAGDEFGFEPGEGGGEALGAIAATDGGLDGGGLAEGGEELVAGEAGEEFLAPEAVFEFGMPENPFPGEEGEDGVPDPGFLTLRGAFIHGAICGGGGDGGKCGMSLALDRRLPGG
jgi:hypothetical protein